MMFDTHCHIQFRAYDSDRDSVMKENLARGVIMNLVGTQKDTSQKAVELAERFEGAYATIGLHPLHTFSTRVDEEETHFVSREEEFDIAFYDQLATSKKVVGVGECGLELFHVPPELDRTVILEKQRNIFLAQYYFAQRHQLAMALHVRDAHDEMITLLHEITPPKRAVVHCFTSEWRHAEQYLDMGLYLGFTGVITFPPKKSDPKAQENLLDVVRRCPLERMVVETDSPYLAANPYRGKRAEPWMVTEVVRRIALEKHLPEEQVAKVTTENAQRLFGLFTP